MLNKLPLHRGVNNPKISQPFKRVGDSKMKREKNYIGRVNFIEICKICKESKESKENVLVGFTGGLKAVKAADADYLTKRKYKWDYVHTPHGKKIENNWIRGDIFLKIVQKYY